MKKRNEVDDEPRIFLDGDQPTIYRKRKIKWTSVLKWGALALAVIVIIVFVWGYVWLRTKESQMRVPGVDEALDSKGESRTVTTLVMGVDKGSVEGEEGEARADILMLVSVDPKADKAAVISIPRDTRCTIPGREGYFKMNAAYALGGPSLTIETVKSFTGLEISHFVVIDFEGFRNIVEAVGGVPMHIDVAIDDKYAGTVPAGDVVLSGEQALSLVRARHDPRAVPAGDLDRIRNQREFLQAMLSKISGKRNPFQVKRLIDVAAANIKTDLSFTEMLTLGRNLQGAGGEELQMATAPGVPEVIGGIWYYIVDMPGFQEMVSSFESKSEVSEVEGDTATGQSSKAQISVAVLNGSGVSGLAAAAAAELSKSGFQNINTGNAESRYTRTTIYYADDGSSGAGVVAADLEGVREPLLQRSDELTSKHSVEVLVVLGTDYELP